MPSSRAFKLIRGRKDIPYRPANVRQLGSGGHTVIIRGKAGGGDVNFLVDTGSEVTLMSMSLARDLGISQVGGTKYVLSSFTRDQIKTIGEVKVALSVAGVQAQHRCIIFGSNMECDILLGMDFVNTHQLNINAKERIVSSDWGTSKFPSSEPKPVVNRIKVRADETTTVPPNSVIPPGIPGGIADC